MGRQEENAVGRMIRDVDAELDDVSIGNGTVCASARAQEQDWNVCCEEMTAATKEDCVQVAGSG